MKNGRAVDVEYLSYVKGTMVIERVVRLIVVDVDWRKRWFGLF